MKIQYNQIDKKESRIELQPPQVEQIGPIKISTNRISPNWQEKPNQPETDASRKTGDPRIKYVEETQKTNIDKKLRIHLRRKPKHENAQ